MEAFQPHTEVEIDWASLLHNYRRGPKSINGPELVGRLDRYIAAVSGRLDAVPPAIDAADVYQQLVMEVLIAADRLPMPHQPQWIPRQLVLRASREVARWLAREKAKATVSLAETLPAGTSAAIGLTFPPSTAIGIRDEDLALLHRFYVLGERGIDLAADLDVSFAALRQRVSRAADRCRDSVHSRHWEDHKGRQGTQKGRLLVSPFDHEDGQLRKDGASRRNIPEAPLASGAAGGHDESR